MNKKYLLAGTLSLLLSCGKNEQTSSKSGANQGALLTKSFLGIWSGEQVSKGAGQLTGNKHKVEVHFLEEGKFKITYPDLSTSNVEGKYHVNSDKMLFEIEKSELPLFGLSGANRLLKYERFETKLLLGDDSADYDLDFIGKDKSDPAPKPTLAGKWYCPYQQLKWIINLTEKNFEISAFMQYSTQPLKVNGTFPTPKDLKSEVEILFTDQKTERKLKMVLDAASPNRSTAFYFASSALAQPSAQYQCERN